MGGLVCPRKHVLYADKEHFLVMVPVQDRRAMIWNLHLDVLFSTLVLKLGMILHLFPLGPLCHLAVEPDHRMAEADRKEDIEGMERERDAAVKANEVSQDALARMAIRNNQLKVSTLLSWSNYRFRSKA